MTIKLNTTTPFTKNFNFNRYYLDSTSKEDIVEQIKKELTMIKDVRFSYLHGSFLEDKSFRDIDIAILLSNTKANETGLEICNKLSVKLTKILTIPVDVNLLNSASLAFCYYVTQGEVLTYLDLEDVYQYKEDIWIKYMDFYPLIKESLADLL